MHDIPRRLGHRVQRAGDGVRQPRRRLRHRRRVHARSVHGRARFYGEFLPNAQGEDVVAASARRAPIRRARATASSLESSCPRFYAELVAIYQAAREALPRHAGHRVHDPEGASSSCSSAAPASARRAAVRIAVEMVARGAHLAREAILRVEPQQARPAPAPDASIRSAPAARKGLPASPGRRQRAASCSRRRRRASGRAQGRDGDPRALRDLARGHPRHEGRARHPHGARRHDEPRRVVARGMGKCCVAGCSSLASTTSTKTRQRRRPRAQGAVTSSSEGRRDHARRRRPARSISARCRLVPARSAASSAR
jgi:pyruvate,orthophosphate dikinase